LRVRELAGETEKPAGSATRKFPFPSVRAVATRVGTGDEVVVADPLDPDGDTGGSEMTAA